MDNSTPEFQESTTIKFEWVVRNLKGIFESSKGDTKSKATKSAKFDGGRWQILFYPNSGSPNADGHSFVSLYLSCEPTAEERANAVDGKWAREGVFKFGFELRNLLKTLLFNFKEASDHSFSSKTQNWGWAQFARRDLVYYNPATVRQQDAFLIVCSITSSPTAPKQPPVIPRVSVPKALLNSVGSLLDDPVYSDIEFVLPRRGLTRREPRRIYAARRLLQREDYFDAMFYSGFAEASSEQISDLAPALDKDVPDDTMDGTSISRKFEDSDDEDDGEDWAVGNDQGSSTEGKMHEGQNNTAVDAAAEPSRNSMQTEMSDGDSWQTVAEDHPSEETGERTPMELDEDLSGKISHPPIPLSREVELQPHSARPNVASTGELASSREATSVPGPQKIRVVVRDVAYTTFKTVLYWIYTDTIVFAPLSSSFLISGSPPSNSANASASTPALPESQAGNVIRSTYQPTEGASTTLSSLAPRTRREWIATWEKTNYLGHPLPCSAKAVYRLADRFDLPQLKERAFQHIVKSLTVENVAYEVFSNFSAAFESVRKVEVRFFLDHWKEIRASDSMTTVWHQIRVGRHPGFEEVWPVIALNLEFKANSDESESASGGM